MADPRRPLADCLREALSKRASHPTRWMSPIDLPVSARKRVQYTVNSPSGIGKGTISVDSKCPRSFIRWNGAWGTHAERTVVTRVDRDCSSGGSHGNDRLSTKSLPERTEGCPLTAWELLYLELKNSPFSSLHGGALEFYGEVGGAADAVGWSLAAPHGIEPPRIGFPSRHLFPGHRRLWLGGLEESLGVVPLPLNVAELQLHSILQWSIFWNA